MFFTLNEIANVVIDLDGFSFTDQELLDSFLSVLDGLRIVAVSTDMQPAVNVGRINVFRPVGVFESGLFQNVIRRAMHSVSARPGNTVYLAKDVSNLKSANELLLGTVIHVKGMTAPELIKVFEQCPDAVFKTAVRLSELLSGNNAGFGGEYYSTPKTSRLLDYPDYPKSSYPFLPNLLHPDSPIVVCGRYFGESDPRHKMHALSMRVIGGKREPKNQAVVFGGTTAVSLKYRAPADLSVITCVPPRPGQDDRLGTYLNAIAKIPTLAEYSSLVRTNLLRCNRDYPKLKNLGASQRTATVNGVFTLNESVAGKTVAVMDDVMTTGSTLGEVVSVLKAGGAKQILPIVLGYHPFSRSTIALTDKDELHCKHCNGVMKYRIRGSDGEPFYGCSQWKRYEPHSNLSLGDSVRQRLENLEDKLMAMDEELDSEDWPF